MSEQENGNEIDSEQIHHKSEIKKVPISKLHIDRSYQRAITQGLLDYLVKHWDVIASEIILVADRGDREEGSGVEGGMFIASGQHRARAAQLRGLKTIEARVIDLADVEDPAAVEAYYRRLANRRTPDRALDTFRAKVREGDEDALGLVKLLEKNHTQVNENPGDDKGGIDAVACLETLYARDGGSTLNETLEILQRAYGGLSNKVATSDMMKGVAWFIGHHSVEADSARLAEKLQTLTVSQIKARAQQTRGTMGKSMWVNVYLVVLDLYNEKLSNSKRLQVDLKGWGSNDQRASDWRERGASGKAR